MIDYCKCGAVMVMSGGKRWCAMELAHHLAITSTSKFNERQAALAGVGYDKRCAPTKEQEP